jgi:hypothetical protein
LRGAGAVLASLLAALVLAEIGARSITETLPNGIQKFGEVTLVPLRPAEEQVRGELTKARRDPMLMRDPDIGWTVRPDKQDDANQTNSQGVRANPARIFAGAPPDGKVRIVTIGDSFVYCSQVDNGETWQDYLGLMREDLEILNLGLPGGGTDQAFLRWQRDGRKFRSHIVILGIWPDNIFRNLSVLEYYLTRISIPKTKPRLAMGATGTWQFVNLPIMSEDEQVDTLSRPEGKALLSHEYWYEPGDVKATSFRRVRLLQIVESLWRRYQIRQTHERLYSGEIPDGIEVTLQIAKMFAEQVRATGAVPLILMIPDRERLAMHVGTEPFPLVRRLRDAGIEVLDLGPTFGAEVLREGAVRYYVGGIGHHSPFGNRVFAKYLERDLRPWIARAQGR